MNTLKKTIWFDQNSEPQKSYIWYRGEGKFYEYSGGNWVVAYDLANTPTQSELESIADKLSNGSEETVDANIGSILNALSDKIAECASTSSDDTSSNESGISDFVDALITNTRFTFLSEEGIPIAEGSTTGRFFVNKEDIDPDVFKLYVAGEIPYIIAVVEDTNYTADFSKSDVDFEEGTTEYTSGLEHDLNWLTVFPEIPEALAELFPSGFNGGLVFQLVNSLPDGGGTDS